MNISAVILAGGESSRMGRDKAWLQLEGEALIVRALRTIREAGVTDIVISGRAGTDYSALGCPLLLDREPGLGPLSGIERALNTTRADLLLVMAVDLPRMTADLLRTLAANCDRQTGVLPSLHGRLEPLAAIYPKACGSIAADCLLKGRRAVRDFAQACLEPQLVRTFDVAQVDAGCFENWNAPGDIRRGT